MAAAAAAAKTASLKLGSAPAEQRQRALRDIATAIRAQADQILEANALDLKAAQENGIASAMLDRLRLDPARVEKIARAVDEVDAQPDVVGRIEDASTRPNGLEISKMRIPLGVVLIIYESRPNVTTDAAALCIKSGNAVILRGGSEAIHSNRALGQAVTTGLESAGLPPACVQIVQNTDRQSISELLKLDDDIDIVIPRGGEGLIRFVASNSRIPVLKHYNGICHVYVHSEADADMALSICENAKVQRPGVCNAAETILVDRDIAAELIPRLCQRLGENGVEIRGDAETVRLAGPAIVPATEEDWGTEYLDLIVSMKIVANLDEAAAHIARFGSNHTESIITMNEAAAERFLHLVPSSTVMVNASTRFADGGELGLGAEIGISTTKMHAYGPMGVLGLTTTKFIVRGTGQIRS